MTTSTTARGPYSGRTTDTASLTATDLRRFWAKVARPDNSSCWTWTAGAFAQGYGAFGISASQVVPAHRLSYELTIGPIPPGLVLRHLCSNKACVNPYHLEPGTQYENRLDDASKLSAQDAIQIRDLYRTGNLTQTEIAQLYGVTQAHVSLIVNRRTHVQAEELVSSSMEASHV